MTRHRASLPAQSRCGEGVWDSAKEGASQQPAIPVPIARAQDDGSGPTSQKIPLTA